MNLGPACSINMVPGITARTPLQALTTNNALQPIPEYDTYRAAVYSDTNSSMPSLPHKAKNGRSSGGTVRCNALSKPHT